MDKINPGNVVVVANTGAKGFVTAVFYNVDFSWENLISMAEVQFPTGARREVETSRLRLLESEGK